MKLSNRILTLGTVAGLVIAGGLTIAAFQSLASIPCPAAQQQSVSFTLFSTLDGFNESRLHPSEPWPIIRVARCSAVTITLQNQDSSQPHGLEVAFYANNGVIVGPGDEGRVKFLASRTGEFKIQCTIPCSIHVYMLNGYLIVS